MRALLFCLAAFATSSPHTSGSSCNRSKTGGKVAGITPRFPWTSSRPQASRNSKYFSTLMGKYPKSDARRRAFAPSYPSPSTRNGAIQPERGFRRSGSRSYRGSPPALDDAKIFGITSFELG